MKCSTRLAWNLGMKMEDDYAMIPPWWYHGTIHSTGKLNDDKTTWYFKVKVCGEIFVARESDLKG